LFVGALSLRERERERARARARQRERKRKRDRETDREERERERDRREIESERESEKESKREKERQKERPLALSPYLSPACYSQSEHTHSSFLSLSSLSISQSTLSRVRLECVYVCCSVLQYVAVLRSSVIALCSLVCIHSSYYRFVLFQVCVCLSPSLSLLLTRPYSRLGSDSVLQCDAVLCSMIPHVAIFSLF